MSKPLIFDKKVDFDTEGYINQLVLNSGFKHVGSIVPHTFYAHFYKSGGVVPVLTTNFFNSNTVYYGQVTLVTFETSAELQPLFLQLNSVNQIYLPATLGVNLVDRVLFDNLYYSSDLASVSASEYNQRVHFTGYKISKV